MNCGAHLKVRLVDGPANRREDPRARVSRGHRVEPLKQITLSGLICFRPKVLTTGIPRGDDHQRQQIGQVGWWRRARKDTDGPRRRAA